MSVSDEIERPAVRPTPPRRGRRPPPPPTEEIDDGPAETGGELDLAGLTGMVGYALRRAQMAVFEDFIARYAALDLKPAQFSVLFIVDRNPGRKQSEIAAALGIQRPNFVAMLDELERRGLAERVRSTTDRRSHAIVLTDAGRDLLARALEVQDAQERRLGEILGPGGRDALVSLLHRLTESPLAEPG